MGLFQRVNLDDVPWLLVLASAALSCFGVLFVISATLDPVTHRMGIEGAKHILWFIIASVAGMTCMHVKPGVWKEYAPLAYIGGFMIMVAMLVLAGSPLVPNVKGAHNWIVLGPISIQPSEFVKLAVIVCLARLLSHPDIDVGNIFWAGVGLAMGGIPAVVMAKEDLGSALTLLPMTLGMLFLAGMRFQHLGLVIAGLVFVAGTGIMMLPEDGYQWRRIQAFLHPEQYALTEAFQQDRAILSVGSGMIAGQGWGEGQQNQFGWLPEEHTDMIFAVVGEETGFIGSSLALLLFMGFGWAGLWAAMHTLDPFNRLVIGGFTCLIIGQMTINLAVVLRLMPVAGITLPFFSYGGSSMLATWCGVGMCAGLSMAGRTHDFGSTRYTLYE